MAEKAEIKRKHILEQARKVFSEKGFKNVTMKDIVLASNISRGGLYLYFSNTTEIFESILKVQAENEQCMLEKLLSSNISATEQMRNFLSLQIKELLNPTDSLIIATYEYLFMKVSELNKIELEHKFNLAALQLIKTIQHGVDSGEFAVDPYTSAQNIIFTLEGFRIASTILTFEEEFLNKHIDYIIKQLRGGK